MLIFKLKAKVCCDTEFGLRSDIFITFKRDVIVFCFFDSMSSVKGMYIYMKWILNGTKHTQIASDMYSSESISIMGTVYLSYFGIVK